MADPAYGSQGAHTPHLEPFPQGPIGLRSQLPVPPDGPVPPSYHGQFSRPGPPRMPLPDNHAQPPQSQPPQFSPSRPSLQQQSMGGYPHPPQFLGGPLVHGQSQRQFSYHRGTPSLYPHYSNSGAWSGPGSLDNGPSTHSGGRQPGEAPPELSDFSNPPPCLFPIGQPRSTHWAGPRLPSMGQLSNSTSGSMGIAPPSVRPEHSYSRPQPSTAPMRDEGGDGGVGRFGLPSRVLPPMPRRGYGAPPDSLLRAHEELFALTPESAQHPAHRSERSASPRTSHRRTFTRFASDTPFDTSTTEADEAEYNARAYRRQREQLQREARARSALDSNRVSASQMQRLRDKLRHFLPSELPKGTSTMCDICQKDYSTKHVTPSEEEEVAIQLPCKHVFGEACINTWFETCKTHKNKITCPMCRKVLIEPLSSSFAGMRNAAVFQALMSYESTTGPGSLSGPMPPGFLEMLQQLRESGGVDPYE